MNCKLNTIFVVAVMVSAAFAGIVMAMPYDDSTDGDAQSVTLTTGGYGGFGSTYTGSGTQSDPLTSFDGNFADLYTLMTGSTPSTQNERIEVYVKNGSYLNLSGYYKHQQTVLHFIINTVNQNYYNVWTAAGMTYQSSGLDIYQEGVDAGLLTGNVVGNFQVGVLFERGVNGIVGIQYQLYFVFIVVEDSPDLEFTSTQSNVAQTVGTTFSYTPTFNNEDVSISISGASWLDCVDGKIIGTPSSDQTGTYTVTITANDGHTTATQTFTIDVVDNLVFGKPVFKLVVSG